MKHASRILPIATLLLAACTSDGSPALIKLEISNLPERITALAVGDFNRNGHLDLISGNGRWFRNEEGGIEYDPGSVRIQEIRGDSLRDIHQFETPAPLVKAAIADVAEDEEPEIILALGWQQYVDGASVHLWIVHEQDGDWETEVLYTIPTPRSQVTSFQVVDLNGDGREDIQISYFTSKYFIETAQVVWTAGDGWNVSILPEVRMAMSRLAYRRSDPEPLMQIVGRTYGDSLGDLGDLYIEAENGIRIDLPAWQGINTLAGADLDGDGLTEVLLSDGWHRNYGRLARARIAVLHPEVEGFVYELIEDITGQNRINQITTADIAGDRGLEIVASGNMGLRIWQSNGGRFRAFSPEGVPGGSFALADMRGGRRAELIMAGAPPAIYAFARRLPWSDELSEEVIPPDLEPEDLIGQPAPGLITDAWLNSKPLSLSELKGKVIVLDFWATWCGPCREMYPVLSQWQRELADDGLIVIGITRYDERQRDLDTVRSFLDSEGLSYPVAVSRGNQTHLRYAVGSIPHTIVIGPDGVVRYSVVGAAEPHDAESIIMELLGK